MTGCMAPDNHDANVAAIRNIEMQWNADWAAKDLDKIVAHYADDVFMVAPGAPALTTKDAVRAAFKEMIADPALSLKFEAKRVEVSVAGDIGYTMGEYQLTRQGITDHGSYVTTYRHQADRTWKAVADINTSAVPPAK